MVNYVQLDAIFSALADPTRRRIVERLSRKPLTVGAIAKGFPLTQPAISKHLRILEKSGLMRREILGRTHYCTISPAAMDSVARWIEHQRKFWNETLDRLEDVLAGESSKRKD
jgi:DNA-binding transcriptional ArsR family regulator